VKDKLNLITKQQKVKLMLELKNLIAAGESSHLEFKSEQVEPEDLAKEIVALLNFQGGKILLGVEDNGVVSGVARQDVEEWVINICRNNVVPQIIPGYQKLLVENKSVVVLDIPAGIAKPYHTQKGDYYIRADSTARKASREELSRLFQDSGLVHYETTPIAGTRVADLNWQRVHDYFLNIHPAQINFNNERLHPCAAQPSADEVFTGLSFRRKAWPWHSDGRARNEKTRRTRTGFYRERRGIYCDPLSKIRSEVESPRSMGLLWKQ